MKINIQFLETLLNDKPALQKHISFKQEFYCGLLKWQPSQFYQQLKMLVELGILSQVREYQSVSKKGEIYTVQKHIDWSYKFNYARCWAVDRKKLKALIKSESINQRRRESFKNYDIIIMGNSNNSGDGLININKPTSIPHPQTRPHNDYINNLETVPFQKELSVLKSLWHNNDYNPQEVSGEVYKYLRKYKNNLSYLLPQGHFNFKFYTTPVKSHGETIKYHFIHINRRLSDINFKTHNNDGSKNEEFNKFMKDNGLITEFDYKASIHQALFHLKQAEAHPKLKFFDIDTDIYTTLYQHHSFSREQIKACANRTVFCKTAHGAYESVIKSGWEVCQKKIEGQTAFDWKEIAAYKNAAALYKLNKNEAVSHIKFIKSRIDETYVMNLWNFEADRNELIKEILKRKGFKCFFNYDCFYTNANSETAHNAAQAAHNATVLNWRKYKIDYPYSFYEKDE
jgi:hypothetical protein